MQAEKLIITRIIPGSIIAVLIILLVAGFNLACHDVTESEENVLDRMWTVGMDESQIEDHAQMLMDVIGPRLVGSPNLAEAQEWILSKYSDWGISSQLKEYGTWTGWQQGFLHVDLTSPRMQTLATDLLAWSPGTSGPIEGDVVAPPLDLSESELDEWLRTIRGKFVLTTHDEVMCRSPQDLEARARPETVEYIRQQQEGVNEEWSRRLAVFGSWKDRERKLSEAGAAGILTSRWSGGWGANRIFDTVSEKAVAIEVSCEDYGLLARLEARGAHPRLRVEASSSFTGEVPQYNVLGVFPGRELPDEYVLLGAHLDSWHGATGATDNGTGAVMMLEAARILSETYAQPRRTIIVAHWGAEEVGLVGSSAFREDHPEIMDGLYVALNQDNGTWRVEELEGMGMAASADILPDWIDRLPATMKDHIRVDVPGTQDGLNSDHAAFLCAGVPSFRLQSESSDYQQYTWHTNLDTYDKIVFPDLKENATMVAMLAYMAAEDERAFSRDRIELPIDEKTGKPRDWVSCRPPKRSARDQ